MPLAAQAGVHPLDFYRMTYKEVMAVVEAFKQNEKIADHRTARICWLIAETNRNSKKRPRPYKIEDFMPQSKKKEEQTPEQMLNVLKVMFGGRAKAGEK